MPIFRSKASIIACAALAFVAAGAGSACAFDRQAADNEKRSPWVVFKFGFTAYKKGNKDEAIEAYRYAAEKGHAGALWKLGRMYAEGDGVNRDDFQAYRFFEQVVEGGADVGSPDESYLVDALLALAGYLKTGIPDTPVAANMPLAQDLYMRAATLYGDSRAQFEIGRMLLEQSADRGGHNIRQAARWLQLSAAKGHAGAQAMLGKLLFQGGKSVQGLALLTAALEKASPAERQWILQMQEEAFAVAPEADRRTAVSLAQDMLKDQNR